MCIEESMDWEEFNIQCNNEGLASNNYVTMVDLSGDKTKIHNKSHCKVSRVQTKGQTDMRAYLDSKDNIKPMRKSERTRVQKIPYPRANKSKQNKKVNKWGFSSRWGSSR